MPACRPAHACACNCSHGSVCVHTRGLCVQDTSSAMHQLRSARKAPPALPMPAAAITEEAEKPFPVEELLVPRQLNAPETAAAGAGLPEEACAGDETAPSPLAEEPSLQSTAREDVKSGPEALQVAARAGGIPDSPLPVIKVVAHPRLAMSGYCACVRIQCSLALHVAVWQGHGQAC